MTLSHYFVVFFFLFWVTFWICLDTMFALNTKCPKWLIADNWFYTVCLVIPGNIIINGTRLTYFDGDVLSCSAVGSPPLFYQWTANKLLYIASGPDFVVNKAMAGPVSFTCAVHNIYGNASAVINTVVGGERHIVACRNKCACLSRNTVQVQLCIIIVECLI